MEGFSSNLNDTFTSTRGCAEPMFFPQHILPLLPLYNAQWWGYESLTAIVIVLSLSCSLLPFLRFSSLYVPFCQCFMLSLTLLMFFSLLNGLSFSRVTLIPSFRLPRLFLFLILFPALFHIPPILHFLCSSLYNSLPPFFCLSPMFLFQVYSSPRFPLPFVISLRSSLFPSTLLLTIS